MNWLETTRAVHGILSRIRELGGFATKTKLVKFLYLLDLESFRETGQTITGFTWRFHLYGPWAPEFDRLLDDLRERGSILVQAGTRPDLDTQFLASAERLDLDRAIPNPTVMGRLGHYVDAWANRDTGEVLDYVYFHTEPMEGARQGEPLDFRRVRREDAPAFFVKERPDRDLVRAKREAIARKIAQLHTGEGKLEARSVHDEAFERIATTLGDDEDY